MTSRTFKKTKHGVQVKTKEQTDELSYKDVVENLDRLEQATSQNYQQIASFEQQIKQCQDNIERMKKDKKELSKFRDEAVHTQKVKAKVLYLEQHEKAVEEVEDTYNTDPTLTDEQNNLQKFARYRHIIATHPDVAEQLAASIIKSEYYTNCIMANPWKV